MSNHSLRASLRCLAHPAVWLSIALLLLNDHLLKVAAPSWLTGKLSDIVGLFFPFVLAAALSLLPGPLRRLPPMTLGRIAFAVTAAWFTAMKATPLGHAWAVQAISALLGRPIAVAFDPTDLLALAMLWPAWRLWRTATAETPHAFPLRAGWLALTLAAAASAASLVPVPPPLPPLPPVVMTIIGHLATLAPDSEGSILLQVRDPVTGKSIPNARVKVLLGTPGRKSQEVFSGKTDENGLLTARFPVPESVEDPEQLLTIVAETDKGSARHDEEVYVGRVYNVLVSTDKPVYQPGQVIHMRALALDTVALKAAQEQPLVLTVQDPQGNRVMRKELTTSRWASLWLTSPWTARPSAATTSSPPRWGQ